VAVKGTAALVLQMPSRQNNTSLHWFACLTAAATLVLIGIGGLVTSREAGMAVPDWPNSYGYNMFLFPVSKWVGGIFYEHSHRLVATMVGVLVVALTRWLGGTPSRGPLAAIGLSEFVTGFALIRWLPEWKSAGYFLNGIGAVVLLAALAWVRIEPARRPLPRLGWVAFALVQIQGLLGGLRVVLVRDEIGIFHGVLAQLFFVVLCAIALLSSGWWERSRQILVGSGEPQRVSGILSWVLLGTTGLMIVQLVLGATMRHEHAGLAISDFPLAHGKLWPAMDQASIELYNQQRTEIVGVHVITAFQVGLQLVHRIVALLIVVGVATSAWISLKTPAGTRRFQLTLFWAGLVLTQALLGAGTIWSNKAADVATAHVLVGALSLATGASLCIIACRNLTFARKTSDSLEAPFGARPSATGLKS
jgi:cytochrome c oxidase assembly protein subunit 15